MAAQTDLWGEIQAGAIRTPVSILREQAALLGPKTQNVIEARVDTSTTFDDQFSHSFNLVVPALENYRYGLFEVRHSIKLYPIQIVATRQFLDTELAFVDWLGRTLSSDETKRIIASLLSQARS